MAFEVSEDQVRHFAVGPEMRYMKLFSFSIILAGLPSLGLAFWRPGSLALGPSRAAADLDYNLLATTSLLPAGFLPLVPLTGFLIFLGKHRCHQLMDIPGDDQAGEEIAAYFRLHQSRLQITVRQVMIAIALLAVYFGISVEWMRRRRGDDFRIRAGYHAGSEAMFRGFEQDWARIAASSGTGPKAGFPRRSAARAAARADYHAAMRRKYEGALARGSYFVEHDPPAPPWP